LLEEDRLKGSLIAAASDSTLYIGQRQ